MSNRIRYAPPPLNRQTLTQTVLSHYPSHRKCSEWIALLVTEYCKLWHLALSYPERRVVAPGCILAVQKVHQHLDRDIYFAESVSYFGRLIALRELSWGGDSDIKGAIETVRSYSELYHEDPAEPWNEMTKRYQLKRSKLRLVELGL